MTSQTRKKLNPFAPEYKPIPAGVTTSPHTQPPLFLPPPLSTACRRPPPFHFFLLPHQIHTYLPSSSHKTQQKFHPTYHVNPHVSTTSSPPPAPRNGQTGRGSTPRARGRGRDKRGFGRGGEGERDRDSYLPFKHRQYSKRGMHNVHQIVPLKRDEENTTVMIKNIPYDCPRKELISMLDNFCLLENQKASNEATTEAQATPYAYDFSYLPIDFKTKKSRGFAFVNFTTSRAVWSFYDSIHLTNWDFGNRLKLQKRIEIVAAKIQGKEELVRHFSGSVFECATDEYLPVCFTPARNGSGQPVELTVIGSRRSAARW